MTKQKKKKRGLFWLFGWILFFPFRHPKIFLFLLVLFVVISTISGKYGTKNFEDLKNLIFWGKDYEPVIFKNPPQIIMFNTRINQKTGKRIIDSVPEYINTLRIYKNDPRCSKWIVDKVFNYRKGKKDRDVNAMFANPNYVIGDCADTVPFLRDYVYPDMKLFRMLKNGGHHIVGGVEIDRERYIFSWAVRAPRGDFMILYRIRNHKSYKDVITQIFNPIERYPGAPLVWEVK
ncbi:MAG: hypothetical protein ABIJ91_01930 [Candidatus Kuenenbacteria bacterium]